MPLLRDGAAIGAISLAAEPGGFSDSQVELLRTFAEQAVIAIASAETYRALQERTAALALRNSEYGERIEQQSATIDVLKAMSASPGDAQPVFELIVRRAREFCGASRSAALEFEANCSICAGVQMETAAAPPSVRCSGDRIRLDRRRGPFCAAIVHVADPGGAGAIRGPPGCRLAIVGVPLLREGRVVGAIMLRSRAGWLSPTPRSSC